MEEDASAAVMGAVYTDDHVDPPVSHVCVGAMVVVHLALLLTALLHRWRALAEAREAEEAFDPSAPLIEGARYVAGRVELAEGAEVAVRVEIDQLGTESKSKNGWSHRWDEMDRRIHAQPFYVRREDGRRVRVEPGQTVLLVDAVDQMVWTEREHRTRTAELTAGEEAIVEGVLRRGPDPEERGPGAGYRDAAPRGWVMRPRPGADLHVSTEALSERHRIRARRFALGGLSLLLVFSITLGVGSTYLARVFAGSPAAARVIDRRYFTTRDSKGRRHDHYVVDLAVERPADGAVYHTTEELDSSDWSRVGPGDLLHFEHVGAFSLASALGRGSSIHVLSLGLMALLTLLGTGFYLAATQRRRWYEGQLVDTGRGRLPQPPTS